MSRVIVSVATGPRFCGGMRRLEAILDRLEEPHYFWYDKFPDGPTQDQIPYGFKVSALEPMLANQTMWLDSSIVPIQPLEKVWKLISSQGYWFSQNYDYTVGQFCSDEALPIMELTREDAHNIPLVIATAFGLGFETEIAWRFFAEWKRLMHAGAFNGSDHNHRHDQTVASVVCHRLGMELTHPPKFIVEPFQQPTEETVFTICR
jgi:hypothetical protein